MHSLSHIDTKELPCNVMKRHKLREILEVDIRQETNDDGTSADGIYICSWLTASISLFSTLSSSENLEMELSDPSTQAGLSMKRAWIQKAVSLTIY